MTRAALLVPLAAILAGCAASATIECRTPAESELTFAGGPELGPATVRFPGRATVAPTEEPGRSVSGRLRINPLVEEALVPSSLAPYLTGDEGGVDLRVRGTYWVHAAGEGVRYEVAIDRAQLLSLVRSPGAPLVVEVPFDGDPGLRLELRLAKARGGS